MTATAARSGTGTDRPPQRRAAAPGSGETPARLLRAAAEILATEGVAGASSRRITEVAGSNLASITYHFGSKEALLRAALVAEVERLVNEPLAELEAPGDPVDRMLAAVRGLLVAFEAERQRAPAYLEALVGAAHDPTSPAGEVVRRLRRRLAQVVDELRDGGVVAAWVDPDPMAALIIAGANGIALQTSIDPDGPSVEQQASQLVGLLLAAGPGRTPPR